jgi:hypothetical protein
MVVTSLVDLKMMKNQRINRDLVEITHGMAIEQKDTM